MLAPKAKLDELDAAAGDNFAELDFGAAALSMSCGAENVNAASSMSAAATASNTAPATGVGCEKLHSPSAAAAAFGASGTTESGAAKKSDDDAFAAADDDGSCAEVAFALDALPPPPHDANKGTAAAAGFGFGFAAAATAFAFVGLGASADGAPKPNDPLDTMDLGGGDGFAPKLKLLLAADFFSGCFDFGFSFWLEKFLEKIESKFFVGIASVPAPPTPPPLLLLLLGAALRLTLPKFPNALLAAAGGTAAAAEEEEEDEEEEPRCFCFCCCRSSAAARMLPDSAEGPSLTISRSGVGRSSGALSRAAESGVCICSSASRMRVASCSLRLPIACSSASLPPAAAARNVVRLRMMRPPVVMGAAIVRAAAGVGKPKAAAPPAPAAAAPEAGAAATPTTGAAAGLRADSAPLRRTRRCRRWRRDDCTEFTGETSPKRRLWRFVTPVLKETPPPKELPPPLAR